MCISRPLRIYHTVLSLNRWKSPGLSGAESGSISEAGRLSRLVAFALAAALLPPCGSTSCILRHGA